MFNKNYNHQLFIFYFDALFYTNSYLEKKLLEIKAFIHLLYKNSSWKFDWKGKEFLSPEEIQLEESM